MWKSLNRDITELLLLVGSYRIDYGGAAIVCGTDGPRLSVFYVVHTGCGFLQGEFHSCPVV